MRKFSLGMPIAALAACATITGEPINIVPVFLSDPTGAKAVTGFVGENDEVYRLPVRAIGTASLQEGASITGDMATRHVPGSTVLFPAASSDGQVFCASSNTNAADPPQYDRMIREFVCFQDTAQTGAFTRAFSVGGQVAAFPVMASHRTAWQELDRPIAYTASTQTPYPADFVMRIVLRRTVPDKNVVFVAQEVGLGDDFETVDYERYELGTDGEVDIFGGRFRFTGLTEQGATVEVIQPVPVRPVALQYTPARTFYVPG